MRDPGPVRPCLEICVDTPDGLATAVSAGADRIELCAELGVGGLTPSPGLIAAAAKVPIPVFAMIRPRAGDFVYGPRDRAAMRADIAAVRGAGLAGVVFGASRPDRTLDIDVLREMREAAAGLGTTLHRAFDLAPDLDEALETAIALGFDIVLTSGGLADATTGRDRLRDLVSRADGRITIMAGSGITPANVGRTLRDTGVTAIHASAKVPVENDPALVRWGFCAERSFATDGTTIQALRDAIGMAAA